MKRIVVEHVNAFTTTSKGGNPAGVVLNAEGLSENEMKKIAKIMGFSETAFVFPSTRADFKVKFFTPSEEVNLCGHATIATFTRLKQTGRIKKKIIKQETKAGVLPVEFSDNIVLMTQSLPKFRKPNIKIEEVSKSLNIDKDCILTTGMPLEIVSTGLFDLLIPIANLSTLQSIKPDFQLIKKISKQLNVVGYHIFTLETLDLESTGHVRNFAPLYDINEESATGTSNGALGCYLIT